MPKTLRGEANANQNVPACVCAGC